MDKLEARCLVGNVALLGPQHGLPKVHEQEEARFSPGLKLPATLPYNHTTEMWRPPLATLSPSSVHISMTQCSRPRVITLALAHKLHSILPAPRHDGARRYPPQTPTAAPHAWRAWMHFAMVWLARLMASVM